MDPERHKWRGYSRRGFLKTLVFKNPLRFFFKPSAAQDMEDSWLPQGSGCLSLGFRVKGSGYRV